MNYNHQDFFLDNHARRSFIKKSILLAASVPLCAQAYSDEEALLHIIRNGNTYKIPFMRNGKVEENGYYDLCKIFADTHDQVAVQMDPNLFSVLAKAQQWLASNQVNRPIILTSGYRTQHTNSMTEGAALNSMHMYGKAADIHMSGIPIDYLARLMRLCGGAGIGIYSSFVHVDTWKERSWRG
ncbi:MAG: DUF882 domain-containing protein [Sulfuricurvum sp.]|nr:DUF882 domain-containing protein [Sulfuricurvum sp.]